MRKITATGFFLLLSIIVHAQPADLFNEGVAAYRDGKFEEATGKFEAILATGTYSPALFYNLGNCCYKSGDLAGAILNYEKAVKLSPDDMDIRANLRLANMQIADRRTDFSDKGLVGMWNRLRYLFTTDGWAWASIVFFMAMFVSFTSVYMIKQQVLKKILFLATFMWFTAGVFAVILAQSRYSAFHKREAIIMDDQVSIGSEPKTDAVVLFVLNSGSKVEILRESGGWAEVKYDPEKSGWVEMSNLGEVRF